MVRSRISQFLFAAVAIKDADSGHSIVSCSDHVMASISNHDCLQWINTRRLEGVSQKLGFVGMSPIQLGTKHAFKIGSDSHLMNFSAELAVLQRGNQRHASRYSNFVASAEWVGYRERK